MNETTDQIESHIRDTRADLSANLNELEQKVKSATDWRTHYARSPGTFLVTALGGGLLLALATNRPRSGGVAALPQANPVPRRPHEKSQLDDSIGVIKGALIALAADQAKSALSKLLPGFEAHLAERDKPKTTRPVDPPPGQREARNGATNIG